MNNRHTITLASAILVLAAIPPESPAGVFSPNNYDECITESMRGVTSDVAARAIIISCRKQFPEQDEKRSRELNHEKLALLTGEGELDGGLVSPITGKIVPNTHRWFKGYVYNGNFDTVVTEVTISLTPKGLEKAEYRLYRFSISLTPLSRSDFKFELVNIDGANGYSWVISSAKGYVSE